MLTNDDVQLLMDALDSYESSFGRDAFVGGLLGTLLGNDKEESKQFMEKEMREGKAKAAAVREKVILLRAKLIMMKDKSDLQEAADFLRRGAIS